MPDPAPGAIREWDTWAAARVYCLSDSVLLVPASQLLGRVQGSSQDTAGAPAWRTKFGGQPCTTCPTSHFYDRLPSILLPLREHAQPRATHYEETAADDARGCIATHHQSVSQTVFAVSPLNAPPSVDVACAPILGYFSTQEHRLLCFDEGGRLHAQPNIQLLGWVHSRKQLIPFTLLPRTGIVLQYRCTSSFTSCSSVRMRRG